MTAWSGNNFNENTTCGDLEDWGGDEFFDAVTSLIIIHEVAIVVFPLQIIILTLEQILGIVLMDGNGVKKILKILTEVEYVYSGFPPPAGTNVILGWHRRRVIPQTQTNAACGNICYGIIREVMVQYLIVHMEKLNL